MEKNQKKTTVEERIKNLEDDLLKAQEYLEDGSHADWHGFQPLFRKKIRNGKALPPHRDWVKNVFIPSCEKAIRKAENILEKLE